MVRTVAIHEVCDGLKVLVLQVHGGHLFARGQLHLRPAGEVVRNDAQRGRGIRERAVRQDLARLDHPQHEIRGAHLERRGGLGHGRVAVDHVQPAVVLGICVGLVARVDHGPRARGGRGETFPNVVRALREGIAGTVAAVAQGEAAEFCGAVGVHPTGADQDLAGDQERDQHLYQARVLGAAGDHVVLVGAVGVPGGVHVVLEQVHRAAGSVLVQFLLELLSQIVHDQLTGYVLRHDILE